MKLQVQSSSLMMITIRRRDSYQKILTFKLINRFDQSINQSKKSVHVFWPPEIKTIEKDFLFQRQLIIIEMLISEYNTHQSINNKQQQLMNESSEPIKQNQTKQNKK